MNWRERNIVQQVFRCRRKKKLSVSESIVDSIVRQICRYFYMLRQFEKKSILSSSFATQCENILEQNRHHSFSIFKLRASKRVQVCHCAISFYRYSVSLFWKSLFHAVSSLNNTHKHLCTVLEVGKINFLDETRELNNNCLSQYKSPSLDSLSLSRFIRIIFLSTLSSFSAISSQIAWEFDSRDV